LEKIKSLNSNEPPLKELSKEPTKLRRELWLVTDDIS